MALTATPIPRTLQMSLIGIRDLSVIETPPVDRLAIRTYVTRYDDDIIRDAIQRELGRGGQVFFVHNRVENIERHGAPPAHAGARGARSRVGARADARARAREGDARSSCRAR